MLYLLLVVAIALGSAATVSHISDGVDAAPWTSSAAHRAAASSRLSNPFMKPPVYQLDLDQPAATRWDHITKDYVDEAQGAVDYIKSHVPAFLFPLVDALAGDLVGYFHEYGAEMQGMARGLNLTNGDIVLLNMVYQLEAIGVNCSNWNTTGPTQKDDPGCVDIDPDQKICYCHAAIKSGEPMAADGWISGWRAHAGERRGVDAPGLCTSAVAQTPEGTIVHLRNLDWNLPVAVRKMVIDIEYMRGGKVIAVGTGTAGTTGIFNGMRYGGQGKDGKSGGWSVSIDAREKGGKLIDNLLQMLKEHSVTPTQHMRMALTNASASSYDAAITTLSATPQIDKNYFIVAGSSAGQGAVISRGLDKADDVWSLDPSTPDGWFRLQTNYDHWNPVPTADDRRTPGVAHMKAVGASSVSTYTMWDVITQWPTFNHHTDYTVITVPGAGIYNGTTWLQP